MAFYCSVQWILVKGASFHQRLGFFRQSDRHKIYVYVNNTNIIRDWSGSPGTVTFRETVGPTSSSELVHSFRNFLQLTWVCHLPLSSLTWPLMDRRWTNQLLSRDIIWIAVALLTGHYVMGKYAESVRLHLTTSAGSVDLS